LRASISIANGTHRIPSAIDASHAV
jgi:hypothetical protein